MSIAETFAFGCLLALANLVGGALVVVPRRLRQSATSIRYFLALGAGFMLGAVFIEILPEIMETWLAGEGGGSPDGAGATSMALVLGGYLVVHLCENSFATHLQSIPTAGDFDGTTVYAALGGLSLHTFFDGVTIATGFLVDFSFGLLVFLAVLLHKIPEGMTAASVMLVGGRNAGAAMLATAIVAGTTLLGVLAVTLLPLDTATIVKYALPFSAGVTLYIAASDLIPELNHRHRRDFAAPLFVILGVSLFYLLHRVIGH